MKFRAAILLLAVSSLSIQAQSGAPGLDSIRQDDLKADLYFLGSDAMRGRLTNTPENFIASEWIKSRFERLGLAPAVPGYFQNYNLMTVTLGQGNALEIVEGRMDPMKAFMTGKVKVKGDALFLMKFQQMFGRK